MDKYKISFFENERLVVELPSLAEEKNNGFTDTIIACPHCKVCSIGLTAVECNLIAAGQQMIEVCQVCGKDVIISV